MRIDASGQQVVDEHDGHQREPRYPDGAACQQALRTVIDTPEGECLRPKRHHGEQAREDGSDDPAFHSPNVAITTRLGNGASTA